MKRVILLLASLPLMAAACSAQPMNNKQVLRRLGLTDDQIGQLSSIQQKSQEEVRGAQGDLDTAKTQLAQLLLDPKADPKEVERLVHAATDAEAKIRIARIQREMAIRQLIGDFKWRKLVLYLRLRRELLRSESRSGGTAGTGPPPAAAENQGRSDISQEKRTQALLQDLLDLMGEEKPSPTQ